MVNRLLLISDMLFLLLIWLFVFSFIGEFTLENIILVLVFGGFYVLVGILRYIADRKFRG
jgi:hypothetical protein